jgi:hypothetical protein
MQLPFRCDSSVIETCQTWAFMTTFDNHWACGFADGLALN